MEGRAFSRLGCHFRILPAGGLLHLLEQMIRYPQIEPMPHAPQAKSFTAGRVFQSGHFTCYRHFKILS